MTTRTAVHTKWIPGTKHQREIVADRIRAKLMVARADGQPGKALVPII